MKRLALISSIVLALAGCVVHPKPVLAQYIGSTSQLTTSQNFTVTMTSSATHQPVNVTGQSAHTILISNGPSMLTDCVISLDSSTDGTHYVLLASAVTVGTTLEGVSVNGYFPFLRLTFNLQNVPGCSGQQVNVSYVGYQNPLPASVNFQQWGSYVGQDITSPSPILGVTGVIAPWNLYSLVCTNPGTAIAYAEVFDSINAPTLGNGPTVEFGVPAGQTVTILPNLPYTGYSTAWIGAATTPSGSTAATTGIVCSTQYTNDAVVYPAIRASQ